MQGYRIPFLMSFASWKEHYAKLIYPGNKKIIVIL
jgi:hypothetical protein